MFWVKERVLTFPTACYREKSIGTTTSSQSECRADLGFSFCFVFLNTRTVCFLALIYRCDPYGTYGRSPSAWFIFAINSNDDSAPFFPLRGSFFFLLLLHFDFQKGGEKWFFSIFIYLFLFFWSVRPLCDVLCPITKPRGSSAYLWSQLWDEASLVRWDSPIFSSLQDERENLLSYRFASYSFFFFFEASTVRRKLFIVITKRSESGPPVCWSFEGTMASNVLNTYAQERSFVAVVVVMACSINPSGCCCSVLFFCTSSFGTILGRRLMYCNIKSIIYGVSPLTPPPIIWP